MRVSLILEVNWKYYFLRAVAAAIIIFSTEKYEHHTPWPAFKSPVHPDSLAKELETEPQESSAGVAYKVTCGQCGAPLGHEFLKDGPGGVGSRF